MKKSVIFIFAVILGTGAGLLVSLCFQITEITDQSMLPSYESGGRVMINRFAFAGEREPHRGDVILMKNKIYAVSGENTVMAKRVIGTAGDRVMITEGQVYVNNEKLDEAYVFTQGISGDMDEMQVPEGKIFVLGDNRAASTDSRHESVGMVDEEDLLGKVILKW